MKNGSFIALHDKYQFKYLLKYPFRYGIQLVCGAKKDHCAIVLGDYIYEFKFAGVITTPKYLWFKMLDKQTVVTHYDLRDELTVEETVEADYYIAFLKASEAKYSIFEYILSKIPLLKRIRFAKDKYMYCDKFCLRILQEIGRLPKDLYCGQYSVDDVPDLLDEYNLLSGGSEEYK